MRLRFVPWVRNIPWRKAWQPTPVFLPGKSHDRGAWQVAAHRVSKSWTQLNSLSMHARHLDVSHWSQKEATHANVSYGHWEGRESAAIRVSCCVLNPTAITSHQYLVSLSPCLLPVYWSISSPPLWFLPSTLPGSDTWREWPQGPHSVSCWLVSFWIVVVFPWITILVLRCFYCVSAVSQFLLACAQGHCIQKLWHLDWPSHLCQCHHQCLFLPKVVVMLLFQSLEKYKNEVASGTLQKLLSFLSYCSFSVSYLIKASWESPSFLFLLEGIHRVL